MNLSFKLLTRSAVLWFGILLLLGGGDEAGAEDWYRFRGPRLDGVSIETEWQKNWPESGPEVAWTAEVGTGFSSVSVSDGRLYTLGNVDDQDSVFCFDAATGTAIWQHNYSSPTDPNEFEGGPTSTPTVDGGEVYTLGRRGDLFCFDKKNGDVCWSANVAELAKVRVPAWGFSGSPLVVDDLLILNVGDAGTALNKKTGELIWSSADKDSGYSSPVPIAGENPGGIVLGSARSFVCVDAKTGREIWRQRWLTTFGCNAADPIVMGDQVFLSSGYNRGSTLLTISENEPRTVWKHKEFQNHLSSSVLIDGYLYGIDGDVDDGASLKCVEWDSGDIKWTYDTVRMGALAAAGNDLIMLSDSGMLMIGQASPSGLELSSKFPVLDGKCWTTPVLSNGRVYCRGARGTLVCLDLN